MMYRHLRQKRKAAIAALSAIKACNNNKKKKKSDNIIESNIDENILFSEDGSVTISSEDFLSLQIFIYLSKQELVHTVSLVSKSWNVASKNPNLPIWNTSTDYIWERYFLLRPRQRMYPVTMEQLFQFLRRPQFSKLKTLVLPDRFRDKFDSKAFNELAQICSQIEEINISDMRDLDRMIPYKCVDVIRLPNLFPQLQKIHLSLSYATNDMIKDVAKNMGTRLIEYTIIEDCDKYSHSKNHLHDDTMDTIAEHCPNLQVFTYRGRLFKNRSRNKLTGDGAIAILQKCKYIKKIELVASIQTCIRLGSFYDDNINFANNNVELKFHYFYGNYHTEYSESSDNDSSSSSNNDNDSLIDDSDDDDDSSSSNNDNDDSSL